MYLHSNFHDELRKTHFPLLHFPPLLFTPDFSTPAFSTPAFSAPPPQLPVLPVQLTLLSTCSTSDADGMIRENSVIPLIFTNGCKAVIMGKKP